MKIERKLVMLYSAIMVSLIVVIVYLALSAVEASVTQSETYDMMNVLTFKRHEIDTLHAHASENILFAVKNPVFKEYFSLPETRYGNTYENGVLQFTERQRILKNEIDQWINEFQIKFHIDETCLIDHTGQEHSRFVLLNKAPDYELSSEEESTPFFKPSFEKENNEVYIQYPYISPDTGRWVFAYTTPIVLDDGTKPAFYHMEMPLELLQNIIKVESGRMYIIDPKGFLIADSAYNFNSYSSNEEYLNTISGGIPVYHEIMPWEYFPSINTISESREFSDIFTMNEGTGKYVKNGEQYYLVYQKLQMFDWILVYEEPYSVMHVGNTTLMDFGSKIGIASVIMAFFGIAGVFVVSSGIAKPIEDLANACRSLDVRNLEQVKIKSNDEVNDVSNAINEMIEQIRELERQKEEFLSMVTHELKTPLTPIIGWCQMLKNPKIMGELSVKQISAIDSIHNNAKRLLQLIGDILDTQKLDLHKMRFDYKQIDVAEMMSYVHANFKNAMAPKNIEFINLTKGQIFIKSDRNRIEQVLNNMITNAIDFVPEKGRIEIAAREEGEEVIFYVKDNGIGIPADKINNLFKKFYQIDTSITRKHGGTGLGLVICKGIVEALGGKIWVESEVNKGSVFYFTIPKDRGEVK